jgi:hypothetical protein
MEISVIFIIIIILFTAIVFNKLMLVDEKRQRKRFKSVVNKIFNSHEELFNSQKFFSDNYLSAVALSETEDKLCFLLKNIKGSLNQPTSLNDAHKSPKKDLSFDVHENQPKSWNDAHKSLQTNLFDLQDPLFIDCRDLISVELIINGKTITKAKQTHVLGGALIGGFLFGGAGAVVGALSGGNERTEIRNDEIEKIDLILNINDVVRPVINLNFFHKSFHSEIHKSRKNLPIVQQKLKEVSHWNGVFTALISRNNSAKEVVTEKSAESTSTADEITNLVKLMKFKAITLEEFDILKDRLINRREGEEKSIASEILKIASLQKNKDISEDDFIRLKHKIINN